MGPSQLLPPIIYIPNWLSALEADNYFGILLRIIHWQTEEIELFGKKIVVPRLVAWYGDANAEYSYSKVSHTPLPWLDSLTVLKNRLEETVNFNSNSVLCNLYRNEKDYMGWHQDNENSLGLNPVIASISLGERRKFSFRHKTTRAIYSLILSPGSLLLMLPDCQLDWQHSLLKTSQPKKERINLTFRKIFKKN